MKVFNLLISHPDSFTGSAGGRDILTGPVGCLAESTFHLKVLQHYLARLSLSEVKGFNLAPGL